MREIIIIAHNLRSTHNVGSLLRTAEGLGASQVICSGYTPYPSHDHDERLPHMALKIDKQINKTALGASGLVNWAHQEDISATIQRLRSHGFVIIALEQTRTATRLPDFIPPDKLALILGREVEGMEPEVLAMCDGAVEIPMYGHKESFNVVQAAAMALYHCRFFEN